MSFDFEIRGKRYCSAFRWGHVALRWPRTVPVCDVLPQCSVYKPSGSNSAEPGAHTRGPRRQPPLPHELQRPQVQAEWGCRFVRECSCTPHSGLGLTASWGRGGWGSGRAPHQKPSQPFPGAHGKFPPNWSAPPPKEDQVKEEKPPQPVLGPGSLGISAPPAQDRAPQEPRVTGSTRPRA